MLNAGPRTLQVDFTPSDATNYQAVSTTVSLTVNPAPQTIVFTPPPTSVVYGVSLITLGATGGASGNPVAFSILSGPGTLIGSTLTITGAGTVAVAADQAGTANYSSATQVTQSILVNKATPTIVLTPSVNPVLVQNAVTFTATLTGVNSNMPTGAVNFFNGSTQLGTGTSNGSGVATYTTFALPVGTASITAVYAGDSNFVTVSSRTLAEVVDDLSLVVVPVTGGTSSIDTVTAQSGGTAVVTFTLTPSPGPTFPADVTLTASGLPTGATGVFSPAVLPAGSSVTTVTLTIQLPPAQTQAMVEGPGRGAGSSLAKNSGHSAENGFTGKLAPLALALLLLPLAGRLRKAGKRLGRLMSILLVLATLGAAIGLSGCQFMSGMLGTSYNVTVTATSGKLSHSTSFTLKVR